MTLEEAIAFAHDAADRIRRTYCMDIDVILRLARSAVDVLDEHFQPGAEHMPRWKVARRAVSNACAEQDRERRMLATEHTVVALQIDASGAHERFAQHYTKEPT